MIESEFEAQATNILDRIEMIGSNDYHKIIWYVDEFVELVEKHNPKHEKFALEDVGEIRTYINRAKKLTRDKDELYMSAISGLRIMIERIVKYAKEQHQ